MMPRSLKFLCPECGGNVGLEVDIQNIFGKIRSKLHTNKIEVTFAGLLAKQVKIKGKKYICMNCGQELVEKTIIIACPYSGERDVISNFVILRATHTETQKKSRPIIIHEKSAEGYIKDAEKSGSEVYKRTAKIHLNTEVGNG